MKMDDPAATGSSIPDQGLQYQQDLFACRLIALKIMFVE
jgi:hypothetical protein